MLGSPPPCRAAMMIARLSLLHNLPRLASMAPFLCLIVAQCEWPDMASPSLRSLVRDLDDRLFYAFLGRHESADLPAYTSPCKSCSNRLISSSVPTVIRNPSP